MAAVFFIAGLALLLAVAVVANVIMFLGAKKLRKKISDVSKETHGENSSTIASSQTTSQARSTATNPVNRTPVRPATASTESRSAAVPPTPRRRAARTVDQSPSTPSRTEAARKKDEKRVVREESDETAMDGHEDYELSIRGPHPKIERPETTVTSSAFLKALDPVLAFLRKYHDHPDTYPVSSALTPGFLYNNLPTHAPTGPEDFAKIWSDFEETIVPSMTHWQHPRYLGRGVPGRSYPDVIAETLAVGVGSPGFIWDASPAVAELDCLMINWAGRCIGLPETFLFKGNTETSPGGGAYMESVGDATLCALMSARTWKTNQVLLKEKVIVAPEVYLFAAATQYKFDVHHRIYGKLVVYASREATRSLRKAANVSMLRLRSVSALAEDDHGVSPEFMERRIQKDISRGMIPCCIVVTLGTAGVLSSDNLRAMGDLAQKYNCWLHLDASGVGGFWIDPKHRPAADDVWLANSVVVDMKMFSPTMVLVWTQNQAEWKMGYEVSATYLKPRKSFAMDARDWGIHLNRRFRSLKMWISYRLIGINQMRAHLDKQISLAMLLEGFLGGHANIRVFGHRRFNTVAFQYYEQGLPPREVSKYTRRLAVFLNESHKVFVESAKVNGASVISTTVSYDGLSSDMVCDLWKDMRVLIDEFARRKNEPHLLRFASSPPTQNSLESMSSRSNSRTFAGSP